MTPFELLSPKRKMPINEVPLYGQGSSPRQVAAGSSAGTGMRGSIVPQSAITVTGGTAVAVASSPAIRGVKRPLASKQGTTSTTLAPIHTFPVEGSNEVNMRLDALANFATSINANQPVASIVDRVRVYETLTENSQQIAEIEGRAFPVAAYFTSHLVSQLGQGALVPGQDAALANNSQRLAYYKLVTGLGVADYLVEDVIKVQPFTGTGALTSYSENDGSDGRITEGVPQLANFYLARSLTVNQIGIRGARAFMIASAADLNSGFTIRAGGRSYVTEEINSIEDQLLEEFGVAAYSITGAASAAPAGHGVRGAPQDPFTGAASFLFADIYDVPTNISIIVAGAAALLQIVALTDQGLDAIRSA
jgi:hypothetical protein